MWPLGQGRPLTSLLYRVSFENRAPLLKQKFESHCILSINVYSTFPTFQALKHLDYISRQTVKATGDTDVGRRDVGLGNEGPVVADASWALGQDSHQGCLTCCFTDLTCLKANTFQK